MSDGMKVSVASYVLYKCNTQHTKHVVEKFSYVKRDPLRSCAFCVDAVEGLSDWEINLLSDIPDFSISDRLLMAANIRNMAFAAIK